MLVTSKWTFYLTNIQPPYALTEVQLNNKFIHEFFFIENIENMFLTAELVIDDKNGFFETIVLTGKENIKVIVEQKLKDPTTTNSNADLEMLKKFEFDIWNITIQSPSISENIYRFYLVEKGVYDTFFGSHYSVGFNNKTISEILQSVLTYQMKLTPDQYVLEPTADVLPNFTIPYLHPIETIKWLVRKARRSVSPHEGGYLFFSTTGNENASIPIKNFVSLSSLIVKNPTTTDFDIYSYRKQNANQYFINTFKEVHNLDFAKQRIRVNGIGGHRYFGINYNQDKNIIDVKQTYSQFINKTNLMGNTAYLDNSIDDINDHIAFYGGELATVQARNDYSMKMLISGFNRREVIMEGALYRYAGKMIFVEQISLNREEYHNKQEYGYWLIKSITHYYSFGNYMQKVTLIKDSYAESDATKGKIINV
jgi:hypothetical protein